MNYAVAVRNMDKADLKMVEAYVLLVMALRANENGLCWASQETLAVDTRLSQRSVSRSVASLVLKGLLVETPSPRMTKCWRIVLPSTPSEVGIK